MNDEVSQRREPPPTLLAELYVNLSAHTAPIIQPVIQGLLSSAQIDVTRHFSPALTNVWLDFCGLDIFCISSLPSRSDNPLCVLKPDTWPTYKSDHSNLPCLVHER